MERPAAVSPRLPKELVTPPCTIPIAEFAFLSLWQGKMLIDLLSVILVPNGITHIFLLFNVIAMISCSSLVIIRKYSEHAVGGLLAVVVTQAIGYGLIFDLNFFLRNLSVMGGLLMVLSDSWGRKRFAFAGLPQLDEKDRKMYFQLAGRVLLIFLFVGFVFSGEWSVSRIAVSIVGLVACVMVVVGFKAKWSATLLVFILSVFNVLINNFWTVSSFSSPFPQRSWLDFLFLFLGKRGLMICLLCSFTPTTPTETLPSTTFSRSCRLCKFSFPSLHMIDGS